MRTPPPSGRSGSGSSNDRNYPDRSQRDPSRTYQQGPQSSRQRPAADPSRTYQGNPRQYPADPSRTYQGTSQSSRPAASDPGSTIYRGSPQPHNSYPQAGPASSFNSMLYSQRLSAAIVAAKASTPDRLWSGNVARLWLSEFASTAGDIILGIGTLIWLLQLTRSIETVAVFLLVMAIPPVMVNLVQGFLAGFKDTRKLLTLLGFLRIGLAGSFVLMHFHTIIPVVMLLAFGLSLSSSLRSALRRGTIAHGITFRSRQVLASGDQLAAGILSVLAPAMTLLIYILNGERIIAIAIASVVCYFLAQFGETRVKPLPDKVLYYRPEAEQTIQSVWNDEEDEESDAEVLSEEHKHAVWELVAPPNLRSALVDINDGMRFTGSTSHALTAFLLICLASMVGGAVSIYEVVYVGVNLHQVPAILGLLFTAAGLGAALASAIVVLLRRGGRIFLSLGSVGIGILLIMLPQYTDIPRALGVIAILGAANVFTIRGGQIILMRHFPPVGQRAVASAISLFAAIMVLPGIIFGILLLTGLHSIKYVPKIQGIGLSGSLFITGMLMLIGAVPAMIALIIPSRSLVAEEEEELEPIPSDDDDLDEDDDYDERGYRRTRYADDYDDEDDESDYESRRQQSYRGENDRRNYDTRYDPNYDSRYEEAYDDEDTDPRRRRR